MSLSREIAEFREKRRAQIPPDALAVIDGAIERLRRSGIPEKCLKQGDVAPDFKSRNVLGEEVELSRLQQKGPVVLSFYRGGW